MQASDLAAELARHGLRVRGAFTPDATLDRDLLRHAPWARCLVLIGNAGRELWDASGAAIEATPGPHPLDQWTQQTVDPIAGRLRALALYPFAGPPHWPFQRWAERAEGVKPSPLGIFIHPEYGLWHAYRAALVLPTAIESPDAARRPHPCATCADQPCLTHCPVNAFSAAGYDVEICVDYVVKTQDIAAGCSHVGCLARLACPVGTAWRYGPDQARFHMAAFVRARLATRDAKC